MGVATGSKRYCDAPTPSVAGASTPKNAQLPIKNFCSSVPLLALFRALFFVSQKRKAPTAATVEASALGNELYVVENIPHYMRLVKKQAHSKERGVNAKIIDKSTNGDEVDTKMK